MFLSSSAIDEVTGSAYPRPQFRRDEWICLNGTWEFAIDPEGRWRLPDEVRFDRSIIVPYAPETQDSGIGDTGFYRVVWYRRRFTAPDLAHGQRLILHFGAVDYRATVWVNGRQACRHRGGYTPFHVDITDLLTGTCDSTDAPAKQKSQAGTRKPLTRDAAEPLGDAYAPVASQGKSQILQTIVVRAEDDPHELTKPRGKQDWQLEPHSIWYPRTTGIWQTVWMERVPATWIDYVRWTTCVERWEIRFEARTAGQRRGDLRLNVRLERGPRPPAAFGRVSRSDGPPVTEVETGPALLAEDTCAVVAAEVRRSIGLSDPGIDDYRNELLWRPSRPQLIEATLELLGPRGEVVDRLHSYTALRSIGIQGDRFVLNGRPFPLRLVLDQGYWPESGLTAPGDAALRRDVELARTMGFNGVRYHQRIPDPRYLYWADRLGLLVWEEMPSAYRFAKRSVRQVVREWTEALDRDLSHPCIIAWVPLNESWGVPDLPDSPAQRHYVQALYHLTKTLDPTRPVAGNDGWESVATDIIGIHDYDEQPERLIARYGSEDRSLARLAERERPGGRLLVLDASEHASKPIMLTEFGGIALSDPGMAEQEKTWGYSRARSPEELSQRYAALMAAVRSLSIFSGFCYTQFADTYQETNGLLYADRTPKFPLEEIALATAGPRRMKDRHIEAEWRERLMQTQFQHYKDPPEDHRIL